jgi:hypothetical protein
MSRNGWRQGDKVDVFEYVISKMLKWKIKSVNEVAQIYHLVKNLIWSEDEASTDSVQNVLCMNTNIQTEISMFTKQYKVKFRLLKLNF